MIHPDELQAERNIHANPIPHMIPNTILDSFDLNNDVKVILINKLDFKIEIYYGLYFLHGTSFTL